MGILHLGTEESAVVGNANPRRTVETVAPASDRSSFLQTPATVK
jgi:hypothetical protein